MPPVFRSEVEESNLLDDIFAELDSVAPGGLPSPQRRRVTTVATGLPRTPSRAKKLAKSPIASRCHDFKYASPQQRRLVVHAVEHVDVDALVYGAEDWDWDDMNSDFMTPKKSSPVKPKVISDLFTKH